MADAIVEQEAAPVEKTSHLGMSDADFMNAPPPEAAPVEAPADAAEVPDTDNTTQDPTESDADDEAADRQAEEDADDEGDKTTQPGDAPKDLKVVDTQEPESAEKLKETGAVDFEAEYKRLLTPFKANGRDIAVNSVDDAISLMQMGANYNKKMAALKPNLKLMKLLENNGLLTEDKISFLIDLGKKDPGAINKLIADSGINPMDIDAEKAGAYKQSTYTVDDREIELDTVLDEIQGTPSYNRTLDIVSTKWDGPSKQAIAAQPQVLRIINDHVSSGIYDIIIKELESERVFGRLNGLSDIEAYRQIGDSIQARGGFNHLGRGSSPAQGQPALKPVVVVPNPSKADEDKLKDKRRAASSTKPAAPSTKAAGFNPLAMSDEEFSKQVNNKFL